MFTFLSSIFMKFRDELFCFVSYFKDTLLFIILYTTDTGLYGLQADLKIGDIWADHWYG